MRISVVVPTWRRPDALARCFQGLGQQNRIADEVVVVARPDDEDTQGVVGRQSMGMLRLKVADVLEPGLVAALNRGLEEATGDVVAFTDDDTVPRRDWVERIETHFRTDPQLGALGGRDWLHPPSLEPVQRNVGLLRWYGRVVGNHHLGVGRPRPVDVLKGANMAFRQSALAGTNVDERLRGIGAEVHTEMDLCFAVKRRGWRVIYDPDVAVDHFPAERLEDDARSGPVSGVTHEHVVHNETYLLLKWLSWWRRPFAVIYWWMVGTRNAPGVALLGERLMRESDRRSVLTRYRATLKGRYAGAGTFLDARRRASVIEIAHVRDLR
jgi:cellulose synthase/poly-beta-1,6-N-acetylglucosamine synthase-like glycosyltransferase